MDARRGAPGHFRDLVCDDDQRDGVGVCAGRGLRLQWNGAGDVAVMNALLSVMRCNSLVRPSCHLMDVNNARVT